MTPIIDEYYPAGTSLRDIYLTHCEAVAALAESIRTSKALPIDAEQLRMAALHHDIGIVITDAPSIHCHGPEPYLRHGIIGAEMLRGAGYPEEWARVAERHTGSGLTAREIEAAHLPLPPRDFLPETLLEKLVCYADKFFSKGGDLSRLATPKSLEEVEASLARFGGGSLARFRALHALFS